MSVGQFRPRLDGAGRGILRKTPRTPPFQVSPPSSAEGPEEQAPSPAPAEARRLLLRTLAILGIFPSLGGLLILARSSARPEAAARGVWEKLASFPIENWVAAGLLFLHLFIMMMAVQNRSRKGEGGEP